MSISTTLKKKNRIELKERPLRTTVIGSYPFPGWLEFACRHLDQFGEADRTELQEDAVIAAIHDQVAAGLDVITDGEQTRLDFNLSFYGLLEGVELEETLTRRFGPPGHDQRGKHRITGELRAPRGLGVVDEWKRLQRLAQSLTWISTASDSERRNPDAPADEDPLAAARGTDPQSAMIALKASVPGPYTLSGRLLPDGEYPDRFDITEALLPIVRDELIALVEAGCREIAVDEPSMSCYAHREDPRRFVDIFNRTVEPVAGKCRLSTHACFGNYKARAVGKRTYIPMFPAFLEIEVDEIHLEMAGREFAEIEIIERIAERMDVAVGIIDVKSYYIETPEDVADRMRLCLKYAPPERLSFAPDCGLSQTARWAARQKLKNMVAGVKKIREELQIN
jgi:5-methyltetrahydropteroyltriglutamate--homocysteine methyltransferase